MSRTYLDNNATAYLVDAWPTETLVRLLAAKQVPLVLGFHVIYESARAFLVEQWREAVQRRFAVLAELAERQLLDFLPDGRTLRRTEFEEAAVGLPILRVLSPLNRVATMEAMLKLARGDSSAADAFIATREAHHQAARHSTAQRIIAGSRGAIRSLRPSRRASRFDDYRAAVLSQQGARMLRLQARRDGAQIDSATAERILRNPASHPILSTWLNCQLRLTWLAARHRTTPAPSRMDDYRHLIESAGCTLFVTADRRLLGAAPSLSPFRPCLGWVDWKARLEA